MLQTPARVILFSVVVFMLMRFPLFSTDHSNICIRFRFDPPQERFQIDAFLIKTLSVLVWTEGLNALKCLHFQTKTH